MRVVRIYTGDDQQSHLAELDLPDGTVAKGERMFFREYEGQVQPRHHSPRRQLGFILAGSLEVECVDGRAMLLPGEAVITDDLTGPGHVTRLAEGTRLAALVLPDDVLNDWDHESGSAAARAGA
jgi:hypothetical protein